MNRLLPSVFMDGSGILGTVLDESKFSDFENVVSAPAGPEPLSFSLFLGLVAGTFYIGGSLFGFLRRKQDIPPGVTRKLFCMLYFTVAWLSPKILRFNTGWVPLFLFSFLLNQGLILSLRSTVRKWFLPARLTFDAVARDGEETHTVLWLWTESLATAAITFIAVTNLKHAPASLLLVPALCSGFADAAAEIVGTYRGKWTYPVFSLAKGKTFHRTIEGSIAFFLTAILISASLFEHSGTGERALLCHFFLPFILTVAEALSPHSWDNPFLYLVGYLTIYTVYAV